MYIVVKKQDKKKKKKLIRKFTFYLLKFYLNKIELIMYNFQDDQSMSLTCKVMRSCDDVAYHCFMQWAVYSIIVLHCVFCITVETVR